MTTAWHCYQQLRSMYQATDPARGKAIAEQIIASVPTCPIPEVAGLGRTVRR
jgi:transposase